MQCLMKGCFNIAGAKRLSSIIGRLWSDRPGHSHLSTPQRPAHRTLEGVDRGS